MASQRQIEAAAQAIQAAECGDDVIDIAVRALDAAEAAREGVAVAELELLSRQSIVADLVNRFGLGRGADAGKAWGATADFCLSLLASQAAKHEREMAEMRGKLAWTERELDVLQNSQLGEAMDCLENLASFVGCNGQTDPHTVKQLDERIRDGMRYESTCSLNRERAANARAEAAEAKLAELEATRPPDDCDSCGNTMDGHVCSTSDVCLDCWNGTRAKLTEAERERDEAIANNPSFADMVASERQWAAQAAELKRERDEARELARKRGRHAEETRVELAEQCKHTAKIADKCAANKAELTALQARHTALRERLIALRDEWLKRDEKTDRTSTSAHGRRNQAYADGMVYCANMVHNEVVGAALASAPAPVEAPKWDTSKGPEPAWFKVVTNRFGSGRDELGEYVTAAGVKTYVDGPAPVETPADPQAPTVVSERSGGRRG